MQRTMRELFGIIVNILMMLVVTQECTLVKTHWTVSLKWVHFIVYKWHLTKVVFQRKKSAFSILILPLLTVWPWTSHLAYLMPHFSHLLNGVNYFCLAYLVGFLKSYEIIYMNSFQKAQNAKQIWGNCNYVRSPTVISPDDLKAWREILFYLIVDGSKRFPLENFDLSVLSASSRLSACPLPHYVNVTCCPSAGPSGSHR